MSAVAGGLRTPRQRVVEAVDVRLPVDLDPPRPVESFELAGAGVGLDDVRQALTARPRHLAKVPEHEAPVPPAERTVHALDRDVAD